MVEKTSEKEYRKKFDDAAKQGAAEGAFEGAVSPDCAEAAVAGAALFGLPGGAAGFAGCVAVHAAGGAFGGAA